MRVLIEGWRSSPTSLSLVAMHWLLELSRRPGVEVRFRPLPLPGGTSPQAGVLTAEQEAAVIAIPADDGGAYDACVRIGFPLDLSAHPRAQRTFVLLLAEFGIIEDMKVAGGRARAALAASPAELITNSSWSLDGVLRTGARPERTHIVPLGVDTQVFKPFDAAERHRVRASLGWQDRFVIANVGTMTWNKGIAPLIEAVAEIAVRRPELLLVLKGDDLRAQSSVRLREAMKQCSPAAQERITRHIGYLGSTLATPQVASILAAADLYVAPYHAEGFNLPVLEAAACGTPVVCTAGGPTDDFTIDSFARRIPSRIEEPASLVPTIGPGARMLAVYVDDIVRAIDAAIEDHTWAAAARVAGPAFVQHGWTWRASVDRLLAVLTAP